MDGQKFCQSCGQKHLCQQIYERLGSFKGPSIVSKTINAFLLPLIVFILSLAIYSKVLSKIIYSEHYKTALGFLLSLLTTLLF
ncbi:MAG: hypothetical protein ACYSSI_11960, partial [Planctomycetota bacterium]